MPFDRHAAQLIPCTGTGAVADGLEAAKAIRAEGWRLVEKMPIDPDTGLPIIRGRV